MRETLRLTLVSLLLTSALRPVQAQTGIPWLYGLQEAQQIARQERRLLLIHFYSDTCPPCRRLEQVVFPNPEVYRAMAANYIPVKVNGERSRDIATQFQVDRWPTDVIADPQGRVLYKTVSPQDPARYVQLLNAVASDFRVGSPPAQFAGRTPTQGESGAGYAYASYDNPSDPRSPTTYPPASARANPLNSPAAGPYAPAVTPRQDYPGNTAMSPYDANASRTPQYDPRTADPYASQSALATDPGAATPPYAGPPLPRAQVNPYVNQYASSPNSGGGAPWDGYDPRSGWSPSQNTDTGVAYRSAAPVSPPGAESYAATRPAWQEERVAADPRTSGLTASSGNPPGANVLANAPPAMDGYCPVTLLEQEKWAKGDARWGAIHRGRTYLFLSQQHQQRFLSDPDRYSPVLSGFDPSRYVDRGELVPGLRAHGMWFRGKIYLFSDEASLDRFSQAPEFYAQRTHEIMMAAGRN